jgi:hypothetical protein
MQGFCLKFDILTQTMVQLCSPQVFRWPEKEFLDNLTAGRMKS